MYLAVCLHAGNCRQIVDLVQLASDRDNIDSGFVERIFPRFHDVTCRRRHDGVIVTVGEYDDCFDATRSGIERLDGLLNRKVQWCCSRRFELQTVKALEQRFAALIGLESD